MESSPRDSSSHLIDTATEALSWMRERTTEELQSFVSRRLALVEQEITE